jgi:hypothetical protein
MFYTFITYCKTRYVVIRLILGVQIMVLMVVCKWFVVVYKRSLCIEMCYIQIKD